MLKGAADREDFLSRMIVRPNPMPDCHAAFVFSCRLLVPVNREIYGAYYGGERRERYQAERDQAHGTLYFSAMGEEGADVLEILPASGENPLDTLERRERDLLLSAALHRLPGPDRTLIRQLYWDGLPRTGIARQEGVSEGAILKSLHSDLQEALSIPVQLPKRKCK